MVVLVPKKIKGEKGDTPEGAPGERLRAPAHPANDPPARPLKPM